MLVSLHRTLEWPSALFAGVILAPFVHVSLQNERWPILVLALTSIALILLKKSGPKEAQRTTSIIIALSAVLVSAIGVLASTDKFLLLGGVLFFCVVLLMNMDMSRRQTLAVVACTCLMIPLPAATETLLAIYLAELEASLFVALGQTAELPVRLSGTQIFFEQATVTINQDCSGTLLIVPAMLGACVAAASMDNYRHAIWALLLAFPIALLMNLVRLAVVLTLLSNGSYEAADEFHNALGFAALTLSWLLPVWLFTDLSRLDHTKLSSFKTPYSLTIMMFSGMAIVIMGNDEKPNEHALDSLPIYVDQWIGEPISISNDELSILNADQVIRRRYTSESNEVLLTAIYHQSSKIAQEHSSERCFRAMGWQVEKIESGVLPNKHHVSFLMVSSGGHTQAVTELVTNLDDNSKGVIRLQLVTETSASLTERYGLATLFADQIRRRAG